MSESYLFAGRYRVEGQLGSGGMGSVLLGEDTRHRRRVAIKVLSPELSSTTNADRFLREIETLAGLSHPNILPLFDSGETNGTLYYVAPVVEGGSLRDHILKHGPLPAPAAVRLGEEIAEALAYAHAHGIVHRDVKPENILLSSGHALVADFGIARALAQANLSGGEANRLTVTGVIVGTPAYMSPEQLSGDRDVDGRSDIYALGIVLAEMLCGRPPFASAAARFTLGHRAASASTRLREAGVVAPGGLADIVDRATALGPEDRFATATDMLASLRGSMTSRTIVAAYRGAGRRVAIAAGVVALAAGAWALWQARVHPPTLNPDLVAVAPFDVVGGSEQVWREGLMDLLARAVDGAGSLRSVTPTVVVRNWNGRADRDGAMKLASSTGAGTVVFGTLLRTGGDSVRLLVSLLDARRGESIEDVELREAGDRVDRLVDSTAVRLLRAMSRVRPIGTTRHGTIAGRSLPAIKAYLRGEQWYRAGRYDSAVTYASRAIELDTSYALAFSLRQRARDVGTTSLDSIPPLDAARASVRAAGLRGRDSLLVASQAFRIQMLRLIASGQSSDADSATVLYERYVAALEELVRRYPDDSEGWLFLGEARTHTGEYGAEEVSDSLRLEPFQRAIALDSLLRPAYFHPIPIFASRGRVAEAQRYAVKFGTDSSDALLRATVATLLAAARAASGDGRDVQAILDTMPGDAIAQAFREIRTTADDRGLLELLAKQLERPRRWKDTIDFATEMDPAAFRSDVLEVEMGTHGRVRAADSLDLGLSPPIQLLRALLGAIPSSAMDTVVWHWRRAQPADPHTSRRRNPWQYLAMSLPWLSSRRDTAALLDAAHRADSLFSHLAPADTNRATVDYVRQSARAHLALARADTVDALKRFRGLPDGVLWVSSFDIPITADLCSRAGSHVEALARIDREWRREVRRWAGEFPAVWRLYRARYAARAGRTREAARDFAFVAERWSRADRYGAPIRDEARAGIAVLAAK